MLWWEENPLDHLTGKRAITSMAHLLVDKVKGFKLQFYWYQFKGFCKQFCTLNEGKVYFDPDLFSCFLISNEFRLWNQGLIWWEFSCRNGHYFLLYYFRVFWNFILVKDFVAGSVLHYFRQFPVYNVQWLAYSSKWNAALASVCKRTAHSICLWAAWH